MDTPVAMVRCRLDGSERPSELRYIPAAEFELWRHLMVTRHDRTVLVDEVSVWVPERADVAVEGLDPNCLEAVARVRFETAGPQGTRVPVARFLPVDTLPESRAALLAHFDARSRWTVETTAGYFLSERPRSRAERGRTLARVEGREAELVA
jgi:hypothetical protein